jgi:hypothetical protein
MDWSTPGLNQQCTACGIRSREGESMRNRIQGTGLAMLAVFYLALVSAVGAAQGFKVMTGKAFNGAVPAQFYLEGNAIPVEKRNTTLVQSPSGSRFLAGLIDTTGYTSQIQQKYIGMVISEGGVSICGKNLSVGSYGFGLHNPAESSSADAGFTLFDQAGAKVISCDAKKDTQLKMPRPLQVVTGEGNTARLYLGRYWVELGESK